MPHKPWEKKPVDVEVTEPPKRLVGFVCAEHHERVSWQGKGCRSCMMRRLDFRAKRLERRRALRAKLALERQGSFAGRH